MTKEVCGGRDAEKEEWGGRGDWVSDEASGEKTSFCSVANSGAWEASVDPASIYLRAHKTRLAGAVKEAGER